MKIIVAGFPKTGTKSVHLALKQLGYTVCDHLENFWYFDKKWEHILREGGTIKDFQEMYDNFDVVMDSPAYFFWKEIHSAFPAAKVPHLTSKFQVTCFKPDKVLRTYRT